MSTIIWAPDIRTFICPGPQIPGSGDPCGVEVVTHSRNKARCDKCAKQRAQWTMIRKQERYKIRREARRS